MSVAAPLVLREGDRCRLEAMTRSSSIRAGLASRARIVLLAADGMPNAEIARRRGPVGRRWWTGAPGTTPAGSLPCMANLEVGDRRAFDEIDVVVATLADDGPPPAHLGVPHSSARLLGEQLQIGFASVARIWRKWDLQPWRTETFKFSTDPELDAKIRDVVGLYLTPPEKAVVLCIDEKSQIQALDRTAPILPIRPGLRSAAACRGATRTLPRPQSA